MGKATGRKRKAGARTASGRLSRAGVGPDRGTDRAQAIQALYGTDGCDAIGRAYRAGLLGEGQEAKALLDTARRISGAYWQAYATGTYTCPLADRTHGSVVELDHERIKRRELWLNDCLVLARRQGPDVDRAFRQLCIDVNPDQGPPWLDRLCWAAQRNQTATITDHKALIAALDALSALTT